MPPASARNTGAGSIVTSARLARFSTDGSVAGEKRVDVTATVLRRGRAVAFMRAEAVVDGELVAAAQVTKSVVRLR